MSIPSRCLTNVTLKSSHATGKLPEVLPRVQDTCPLGPLASYHSGTGEGGKGMRGAALCQRGGPEQHWYGSMRRGPPPHSKTLSGR